MGLITQDKFDPINWLIPLSVIQLSIAYCIFNRVCFNRVWLHIGFCFVIQLFVCLFYKPLCLFVCLCVCLFLCPHICYCFFFVIHFMLVVCFCLFVYCFSLSFCLRFCLSLSLFLSLIHITSFFVYFTSFSSFLKGKLKRYSVSHKIEDN